MLIRVLELRRFVAGAVAVVFLVVLPGCAARTRTFSSRFVKPGQPTATFDLPQAAPKAESLGDYARRLRTLQANARTNLTLGTTLESRDPGLARAILRVAMEPSANSYRLLAEAYRQAGVTDYAYKNLKRALQADPCDSRSLEALARLWRDWGTPQLALGDAHRAVYCQPHSASAYNTLGTVFAALDQRDNARSAFEFALRLDGRAAFALNNLCYLALQNGDGVGAQDACSRALALDPTMAAAHTNLALAYAIQGDVSKAEARLLDGSDVATGHYNVGVLRMSLNQYGAAAAAFDLAASTRPGLGEAARRAVQARAKTAAAKEQ
jgi:Flp pilus assembly protein TadD